MIIFVGEVERFEKLGFRVAKFVEKLFIQELDSNLSKVKFT